MAEKKRKHWERPQILSDLPLRDTDQAHFHFDEFAGTLALLVADPATRTPLSIGVSGPWGAGKTTLLRRVKTLLDTRDKDGRPFFASEGETARDFRACKTVWFDAWKYRDEEELLVALVRVILDTMGRGSLGEQLWSEILDKSAPRYDVLATFINMFKVKFGGLEIGLDINKYKTETEFKKHTAFFDHFDSAFEELLARWVHGKGDYRKIDEAAGALVVFIDDLDRCLPDKTVQVLEAVKLFLDKPGCIFLIGAHTQMVQDAVKKFYEGMSPEAASDYIEKIIQLRFELPPILETQMGAYLDAQKEDHKLASAALENWETIVAGAEINPRKVKTFLNDLNLAWALLVNSGQAENVARADFTRWQVLRRAAPDFEKAVREVDDLDLRFQYLQRALAWQNGEAQAAEYFKDFEKNTRLKRTLRKIGAFGPSFDARVLDAFIHLVAPPRPPEAEKAPAEARERTLQESMPEAGETLRGAPVEKAARRVTPTGEAAPGRPGLQGFGGLPCVLVPKGKFLMGSRDDNSLAYDDEKPQHTLELPYDYWMGRFPVTNEQFARFIDASGMVTTAEKEGGWNPNKNEYTKGYDWRHPLGPKDNYEKKLDHPVAQVNWHEARAFCDWLNQAHEADLPKGHAFRLPTEAEWEKAARGEFGFEWPWGNEFDENKCNSQEGGKGGTTPVGLYSPAGDSPYGCADMVGNVWEWMQSLWGTDFSKPSFRYPYVATDGRENAGAGSDVFRVVRGGSFLDDPRRARCAARDGRGPEDRNHNRGFRVVVAPVSL